MAEKDLTEKLEAVNAELHRLINDAEGDEERGQVYDVIEALEHLQFTVRQRNEGGPGPR